MSRKAVLFTTATAGLLSLALVARAQNDAPKPRPPAAAPSAPSAVGPKLPFEKFTLENGLTVLLHRDPSLPIVAVELWYRVGPVNEPPGRSGFAHLFEHLMFEGS